MLLIFKLFSVRKYPQITGNVCSGKNSDTGWEVNREHGNEILHLSTSYGIRWFPIFVEQINWDFKFVLSTFKTANKR